MKESLKTVVTIDQGQLHRKTVVERALDMLLMEHSIKWNKGEIDETTELIFDSFKDDKKYRKKLNKMIKKIQKGKFVSHEMDEGDILIGQLMEFDCHAYVLQFIWYCNK